jgi:hypothetical protein
MGDERGKRKTRLPDEHHACVERGKTREQLLERRREDVVAARDVPEERGVDYGLGGVEGESEGGEEVRRAGEQEMVGGVECVEHEEARDEGPQRRVGWRGRRRT